MPMPVPSAAAACLSARAQHTVRQLTVRQDCVMLIRRGGKCWQAAGAVLDARPGMLLAVPRGVIGDVTNRPDAAGRYEALVLAFAPELLAEAGEAMAPGPALAAATLLTPGAELREAVERAGRTLLQAPAGSRLAWLRAAEVVELLRLAGVRFAAGTPDLPERVVRLVGSDPGRAWTADEVAAALALGTSTLRRQLAQRGTSFSGLLRELRLERGLGLLQSTARPVASIALEVGFQSPSRFSEAFRARFGFLPSVLRGR